MKIQIFFAPRHKASVLASALKTPDRWQSLTDIGCDPRRLVKEDGELLLFFRCPRWGGREEVFVLVTDGLVWTNDEPSYVTKVLEKVADPFVLIEEYLPFADGPCDYEAVRRIFREYAQTV